MQVDFEDVLPTRLLLALGTTLNGRGYDGSTRRLGLYIAGGGDDLFLYGRCLFWCGGQDDLRDGGRYLESIAILHIHKPLGGINARYTPPAHGIQKTHFVADMNVCRLQHIYKVCLVARKTAQRYCFIVKSTSGMGKNGAACICQTASCR